MWQAELPVYSSDETGRQEQFPTTRMYIPRSVQESCPNGLGCFIAAGLEVHSYFHIYLIDHLEDKQ